MAQADWTSAFPDSVSATVIPTTLFLVFVHPAPAEDCPCFEDAVAFVSVVCGIAVGRSWSRLDYVKTTLGAARDSPLGSSVWAASIVAKLVLGIVAIFGWRLVAKEVCHAVLPPVFRFFSAYLLPRRHYLVATEYDKYKKTDGLHPVPSLLDLPTLHELEGKDVHATTGHNEIGTTSSSGQIAKELRNTAGATLDDPASRLKQLQRDSLAAELGQGAGYRGHAHLASGVDEVKRDADVLTKFIVCEYRRPS